MQKGFSSSWKYLRKTLLPPPACLDLPPLARGALNANFQIVSRKSNHKQKSRHPVVLLQLDIKRNFFYKLYFFLVMKASGSICEYIYLFLFFFIPISDWLLEGYFGHFFGQAMIQRFKSDIFGIFGDFWVLWDPVFLVRTSVLFGMYNTCYEDLFHIAIIPSVKRYAMGICPPPHIRHPCFSFVFFRAEEGFGCQ